MATRSEEALPATDGSQTVLDAIVVGCGSIGGGDRTMSHAAAYARHDGFRLVACVEPDDARRSDFMARWNVSNGYKTIQEAVGDGGDWAVASVCTPTRQHASDLGALLETGVRTVWCEKPLTGSAGESEDLAAAYRRAGKHLAVNYLRRWHPAMERLQAALAAGEWGTLRAMTGFYTKGLRNNGSHMIDLVHYLAGPLEPVAATMSRIHHDQSDPTVDAMLRTRDGAPVHIVGGDAGDYALFELEIVAAKGAIRIEQSGRAIRTRRIIDDPDAAGYYILDGGECETVGTGDVFLRAAANIHGATLAGVPLASDAETAVAAERVCDALIALADRT